MSHQKRNGRIVHEFVGHPTEQPLTQGQMTVSTHNDEVGLAPFGLRHQLGCDFNLSVAPKIDPRHGANPDPLTIVAPRVGFR
jgi:hypothetical protein